MAYTHNVILVIHYCGIKSAVNYFQVFKYISKILTEGIEAEKQVIGILVDSVAEVVYLKASEIF